MRASSLVLVLLAASSACAKSEPKAAATVRPNWLVDVPYLPQSVLQDTTGTPDVQHVVLLSPGAIDSVAGFYRTRLKAMGWRVVSDVGDSVHVSLYVERNGLSMWIQMDAQGPQTLLAFTATGGAAAPKRGPAPALH